MANVERTVKLPDGNLKRVRVPEEWGSDEIKAGLSGKGLIKPPLTGGDFMLGIGEVAANFITYFPAMAGATLYGALKPSEYVDRFQQSVEATANAGTFYQPQTIAGKALMHKIEDFFASLQFGETAGDKAFNITGSPTVAAAAKTLGDGYLLLLPLLGMKGGTMKQTGVNLSEKLTKGLGEAVRDAEKSHNRFAAPVQPEGPIPTGQVGGHVQVPTEVKPAVSRKTTVPGFEVDKFEIGMIDVITEASKVIAKERGLPSESKPVTQRLFEDIGDLIREGHYNEVQAISKVRQKYNLDLDATAALWEYTISFGGKALNRVSQLRKELNKMEVEDPVVASVIRKQQEAIRDVRPPPLGERVLESFLVKQRKLTNLWRLFLTSSLKTAVRNVATTSAYIAMDSVERAATAFIMGTGKGLKDRSWKPFMQEMRGLGNAAKAFATLHPFKRQRLFDIVRKHSSVYDEMLFRGARLAKEQPVANTRLGRAKQLVKDGILNPTNRMSEVYGDMYLPKLGGFVHLLNTVQERALLRTAFEMDLRHRLALSGKNFDTIHPKAIPKKFLEDSWDFATKMTFSKTPQGKLTQRLIKGFSDIPIIAQTFPFPRFVFGNALPFVFNHGPWAMLRLLDRTERQFLLKNPRELVKATTEATVGSYLMAEGLSAAWNMDEGQRWTEDRIEVGKEEENLSFIRDNLEKGFARVGVEPGQYYVDTTPYSPFAYYRGVAQMLLEPESVSGAEKAQILTGLNRISGTGLGLVEIFKNTRRDGGSLTMQLFERTLGNFLGGFAMPGRTVRDIYAGWNPEEAIYRDVGQNPLIGPFFNNVPWLNRKLPPKFSPFYDGPRVNKHQRFGQLTGFNLREKTEIEKEMQRLDIPPKSMFASTGNALYDNTIHMYQGKVMKDLYNRILESPRYKNAPETIQRRIWLGHGGKPGILSEAKARAIQQMAHFQPKLTKNYLVEETMPRSDKEIFKLVTGIDLDEQVEQNLLEGRIEESPARSGL